MKDILDAIVTKQEDFQNMVEACNLATAKINELKKVIKDAEVLINDCECEGFSSCERCNWRLDADEVLNNEK